MIKAHRSLVSDAHREREKKRKKKQVPFVPYETPRPISRKFVMHCSMEKSMRKALCRFVQTIKSKH